MGISIKIIRILAKRYLLVLNKLNKLSNWLKSNFLIEVFLVWLLLSMIHLNYGNYLKEFRKCKLYLDIIFIFSIKTPGRGIWIRFKRKEGEIINKDMTSCWGQIINQEIVFYLLQEQVVLRGERQILYWMEIESHNYWIFNLLA